MIREEVLLDENLKAIEFVDEDVLEVEELLLQHGALPTSDPLVTDALPPADPPAPAAGQTWYLGIDIGTTGISAVLLNRLSYQLYPIYWSASLSSSSAEAAEGDGSEQRFRLPALVSLTQPGQVVGGPADAPEPILHDFKPYLKLGIPYQSSPTAPWEPVVQWADSLQLPLTALQQALRGLVATLGPASPSCAALGLEPEELQTALGQLAGVIVGCPADWPETYRFNLREVILEANLIPQADRIFLIEETIATLLSTLRSGDGRDIILPQGQNANLHDADWRGNTLMINAGATVTELAIVNLPGYLLHLTHSAFWFRSVPYAGNGVDQDIVCQLLYPALLQEAGRSQEETRPLPPDSDFVCDSIDLEHLDLDTLNAPSPGEPDLPNRYRLQQQLQSSRSGQLLLEAARYAKVALQQQSRVVLTLGQYSLTVQRQDLGSQVLLPYVQRLNRELNTLLTQTHTQALEINQVICTGGTASLGAIARWLRQKLPNATIIQDTYVRPASLQDNCIPSCSRVAYGLAALPLHPQILDQSRQQYNDYFLLLELLRAFPNQPISAEAMLQILERRGIDTDLCRAQIVALLDGWLPPGLIPTEQDAALLAPSSRQNPDYQAIQLAPLFHKQSDRTYRPNRHQWNQLRHYLEAVLMNTHQKLAAPSVARLVEG